MANGSPVVSTPTGSIPALVLDGCGLLVEPGSVESLACGLALAASNPAQTDSWAHHAYRRLGDEFDGGECARRLSALIGATATSENR